MRFFNVWCQRSILPWVWGWKGAPRICVMPRSSSHSARSPATYEEPLSLSRRGRWATWALSQPDAVSDPRGHSYGDAATSFIGGKHVGEFDRDEGRARTERRAATTTLARCN